jgi:hypothetical protein
MKRSSKEEFLDSISRVIAQPPLSVQREMVPVSFPSPVDCDLLASLLLGVAEGRIRIFDLKFTSDKSLIITCDVVPSRKL